MEPRPRRGRVLIDGLFGLILAALAVVPWVDVLDYDLTAMDTIPTIVAARVDGVGELPSVLTRELRGGTDAQIAYYRPLTLLTYSVDWLIGGWDARGYHRTDIAVHALAVLILYLTARLAFDLSRASSAFAAVVFALHPSAVEVVPAIARRQEPMLVAAVCVALIGARRLGSPVGWLLCLAGSVAAVTTVERGLFVPAAVFAYLLFFVEAGRPARERLVRSVVRTIPVGLVAVAFYLLRGWLFSDSGIHFSPRSLVTIPARFALALVFPQEPLPILGGGAVNLAVVAAAVGIVALGIACVGWSSARTGAYLALLGWIAGFVGLCAVAGSRFPWYVYTTAAPFCVILALTLEDGARRIAVRRGVGRGVLGVVAVLVVLGPTLVPSPAWTAYPSWGAMAEVSRRYLDELERVVAETPEDTPLRVVGTPFSIQERERDWKSVRAPAALGFRSVDAWLEYREVERPVEVLGLARYVGRVTPLDVTRVDPGHVRVAFPVGAGGETICARFRTRAPEGSEPAREPGSGAESTSEGCVFEAPDTAPLWVFDGERLVPVSP